MPTSQRRYDPLGGQLVRLSKVLEHAETTDRRGVHRIRVATRRLRELLPVLQLDKNTAERVQHRLRKLTRRLGTLRELDVQLLLVDELHRSGRFSKSGLSDVRASVERAQAELRDRLSAKELASDTRRLAGKLDAVVEELARRPRGLASRASRWVLEARVARRASVLREAIGEAGAVYLPERLHEVRIAQKKLRYGLELLMRASAGHAAADLRVLKRAQDVLGRLHDLQILMNQVRRLQGAISPPTLVSWRGLDDLLVQLEDECRRLHARYVRVRPKLLEICARHLSTKATAGTRASAARKAG